VKSFTSPSEELSGLLADLAEDALSPQGIKRLVELLAVPSGRAAYVDYMATDALLRWRFATPQEFAEDTPADLAVLSDLQALGDDDAQTHDAAARTLMCSLNDRTLDKNQAIVGVRSPLFDASETEDEPIQLPPSTHENSSTDRQENLFVLCLQLFGRRWGAAAAVILLASVVTLILHSLGILGAKPADPIVMGRSLDAIWLDPSSIRPVGTNIPLGMPQVLSSGFVELTSFNGLAVIIQGPANFTVQKPGVITLSSGRLTARVPEKARGFTVDTAEGHIVDLGTEFGVAVDSAGQTDVQTFRGQITVNPAAQPANSQTQSLVVAGAARRIDSSGTVTAIAPDTTAFIRPHQFEDWAALPKGTSYERWTAYSQVLRCDPDIIACYTFDNAAEAPNRLLNRSILGSALDGTFALGLSPADASAASANGGAAPSSANNPTWATGRWPQKGALAFDPQNRSRIALPVSADDPLDFSCGSQTARPFTIAGWICPTKYGSIISKGPALAEQYAIDIDPSGHLRAWVRDPESDPDHPVAVVGSTITLDGRSWVHFTMTYEPSVRSVRLYIDGALAGEATAHSDMLLETAEPIRIGARLRLMNALTAANVHSPFLGDLYSSTFRGRIDELSLFRRAITAEEVKEMYELGRPG
jgi:hypothetical protein